jgi:hypothetical protein
VEWNLACWSSTTGAATGGRTPCDARPGQSKPIIPHRHQIAEPFRLLKQEFGWGSCSCRTQQAQGAHLHLGLYALVLTQPTAFAQGQTIYAFRQPLFLRSIPQNPSMLQEFALAA